MKTYEIIEEGINRRGVKFYRLKIKGVDATPTLHVGKYLQITGLKIDGARYLDDVKQIEDLKEDIAERINTEIARKV